MRANSSGLIALCRPGFEAEAAAELTECAGSIGAAVWCRAKPGMGWVSAHGADTSETPLQLLQQMRLSDRIFIRDWFWGQRISGMVSGDRVTPIIDAMTVNVVSDIRLAVPDTGEGRALSRLCKQLGGRLTGALADSGRLKHHAAERAQVLFLDGSECWVGAVERANSSPWVGGIPRLKLGGAPSRSAAKLDEAFIHFLGEDADKLLLPGQRAVDLGAAPGGWTWQFVRRSIRVTAVDHGMLRDDLLESGLVSHLAEDAFRYQPPKTADWLVCDIVDKPARVAELMSRWLIRGWCQRAIFNLKLPMKKRFDEVQRLLGEMRGIRSDIGQAWAVSARQLYHDREEITVYARPS